MSYDSFEAGLASARFKARAWAHEYNNYFPAASTNPTFDTLANERAERLSKILGHVGSDVFIEPPFSIDYGCNISLGNRFYSNFNLTILDCSLVTIGDRCMFGPKYVSQLYNLPTFAIMQSAAQVSVQNTGGFSN